MNVQDSVNSGSIDLSQFHDNTINEYDDMMFVEESFESHFNDRYKDGLKSIEMKESRNKGMKVYNGT